MLEYTRDQSGALGAHLDISMYQTEILDPVKSGLRGLQFSLWTVRRAPLVFTYQNLGHNSLAFNFGESTTIADSVEEIAAGSELDW